MSARERSDRRSDPEPIVAPPESPGPEASADPVEALQRPSTSSAALWPSAGSLAVEEGSVLDEVTIAQQGGGGRGMPFMSAGGPALVGGLLVVGDAGT